jgi:hypothetical protein
MKGIVFNLLEESVREDFGEDAWDGLLETAGLDGAYTSLGTYADQDLLAIVMAASQTLGKSPADVVRWFGEKAARHFRERYPVFYEGHNGTRSFLLTLNEIIHPEVRKLYPGADAPEFDFSTLSDGRLSMVYRSKRKLCTFAEGLILGTARVFGESVDLQRPSCVHRGDPSCVLVVSFERGAAAP